MRRRPRLAVFSGPLPDAALFAAGLIAVLALPSLAARAPVLIPAVIVASLLIAAPVAACAMTPRLRLRRPPAPAE
jgi:hypothetical protein